MQPRLTVYEPNPFRGQSFELGRELGKGAFGQVFVARNLATNATLVLKRIAKPTEGDAFLRMRDMVYREVAVLRHLRSQCEPYLLCLDDFFETDQFWYIATEFLGSYVTLLPYLTQRGAPPMPWACHMADELVRGLKQIHAAHVAHRDIKPDNLMVDEKNLRIKYIDFGTACYGEDCVTDQVPQGITWKYAAPEIRRPEPHTLPFDLRMFIKGDIWSLGITIYVLFTSAGMSTDWILEHGFGHFIDAYRHRAPLHYAALNKMLRINSDRRRLPTRTEDIQLRQETAMLMRSTVPSAPVLASKRS